MINKAKKLANTVEVHNTLSFDTEIIGNIITKDDMRFDGTITGDISSQKKLVVGAEAVINGNVRCGNIDSQGQIQGDVVCEEKVILRANSRLKGNITTRSLEIEPGAFFEGTCGMPE
jgi:cytoskeletal protein CcmA (bactofilin family)